MMFNNLYMDPDMSPNMMNMMNMHMKMNNMKNMNNMGMNEKNSTLIRLKKEFELCANDNDLALNIGTCFGLIDRNYYKWKTTIIGPKDTPYEDGIFFIKIIFPEDYPKHGAEFKFMNKIYHLNVDLNKNTNFGHISISTLNAWRGSGKVIGKRCYGVKQALFDIYYMFFVQGLSSTYDERMADLYINNPAQFEENARRWTKLYAMDYMDSITFEDYKNKNEILNLIAKGGYGEIYKVKIKNTGELRAIKLINKVNIRENLRNEYNSNDIEEAFEEFQMKLLDEIKIMEICSNTNTNQNSIKFYDYYNNNENLIIVMELCDTNLQFLLNERKKGFNAEEIHGILTQLNNTFKIMKDNKIIHRDLKLANILVKYEDNDKKKFIVKLTDYGISKQLSSISKCFTHIGTLFTMAPEILNGEKYNSKCDIWSLGIIIYQLYFKEYPFKGDNEIALLRNIDNNGQKYLKNTNDPNLDYLIRKMLIKDPNMRYNWEQYLNDKFFSNK